MAKLWKSAIKYSTAISRVGSWTGFFVKMYESPAEKNGHQILNCFFHPQTICVTFFGKFCQISALFFNWECGFFNHRGQLVVRKPGRQDVVRSNPDWSRFVYWIREKSRNKFPKKSYFDNVCSFDVQFDMLLEDSGAPWKSDAVFSLKFRKVVCTLSIPVWVMFFSLSFLKQVGLYSSVLMEQEVFII